MCPFEVDAQLNDRGLIAIPIDDHKVFVSWRLLIQDKNANFQLERATSQSGSFSVIHTTNGITAFHDTPGNGTYYYRVKALAGDFSGTYSEVVTVTTKSSGIDYVELFPAGQNMPLGFDNMADTDGDGKLEVLTRTLEGTYKYQLWEVGASAPRWTFDTGKTNSPTQGKRRTLGIVGDFGWRWNC